MGSETSHTFVALNIIDVLTHPEEPLDGPAKGAIERALAMLRNAVSGSSSAIEGSLSTNTSELGAVARAATRVDYGDPGFLSFLKTCSDGLESLARTGSVDDSTRRSLLQLFNALKAVSEEAATGPVERVSIQL